MRRWLYFLIAVCFLTFGGLIAVSMTHAQSADSCPANTLLALARAGSVCSSIDRNQVCFGNGDVTLTAQRDVDEIAFDRPGAIVPLEAVRELTTAAQAENWGVAVLHAQTSFTDIQQRSLAVLLFGDARVIDEADPTPLLTLSATGQVNIRPRPDLDADVDDRVGVRDTLLVNGRSEAGDFVRIMYPGTNEMGWVSAESPFNLDGDVSTLAVVTESTPFLRPYQIMTVETGRDDALCDGAPDSGVLLQAPNVFDPVQLTLNALPLEVAGTVFVQAQVDGFMTLNVLDGELGLPASGAMAVIPAGARVTVALDGDLRAVSTPSPAEPFAAADVAALPVNNLPSRVSIPEPITTAGIDSYIAERFAPEPTPLPTPTLTRVERCQYTVVRDDSLRAGPGMFYEIEEDIARGRVVRPLLAATDPDGAIWWQLEDSKWIRSISVESNGECDAVPFTDVSVAPGTNTLRMETCETTNGPLRAGQRVTITFRPPPWLTQAEAQGAPRWDPGTVTINDVTRLSVQAGQVVRLGDEAYVRTFSAVWEPEPGTYRVFGGRLDYRLICNLTVPVG